MIGLDTNVLARLIVKDDAAQLKKALQVIRTARANGDILYVSHIVLCELAWLLTSRYAYSKAQFSDAVKHIIYGVDFMIEEEQLTQQAFEDYLVSKADFADILIALRHKHSGCSHTLTFDQQAAKSKHYKLLK